MGWVGWGHARQIIRNMVLRLGVGFRFFASNLKIMRNRDTFAHRDITHKASPGHVVGVQLQQTLKRKNRLGQRRQSFFLFQISSG